MCVCVCVCVCEDRGKLSESELVAQTDIVSGVEKCQDVSFLHTEFPWSPGCVGVEHLHLGLLGL